MEFVYPSFLYALILLTIPLAIHFLNLRRYKRVFFSNVLLLEQIQLQSRSRDRLKKILLLCLRLVAFMLLILAFCQPYIPSHMKAPQTGSNLVSIYIDNSYSMSLPGPDGNLLITARKKAAEIASAFDLNTRFQLLTNDFEGRNQRLVYRDEFLTLLTRIQFSPLNRTIPAILSREHALTDQFPAGSKQSFLISDFQKNMLQEAVNLTGDSLKIHLIRLSALTRRNIFIDSVWNLSKVQRPGEKQRLVIRISQSADDPGEESLPVALKVTLNGHLKALSNIKIRQNTSVNDTLGYLIQDAGIQQLEVSLADQPVSFDDHFFSTWNVEPSAAILEIYSRHENPFIKDVYLADPYFNLTVTDETHIDYASLGSKKLIILNELAAPATALNTELSTYLSAGGNVLFLPGAEQGLPSMRRFLGALGVDTPDTLVHQRLDVKMLELRSGIFEGVFDKYPANPNLPYVNYYLRYSAHAHMLREPVMRLAGQIPLLTRYQLGRGHWYQSAIPFSDSSGNFQRHALFVPVMYQMALLSSNPLPLFYTVGIDRSVLTRPLSPTERADLRFRSGSVELIPEVRQDSRQTALYIGSQLTTAGFYDLYAGGKKSGAFAFNYNRNESLMTFFDLPHLQELTGLSSQAIFETGRESMARQIKQNELGTQLWKVCLILALVFLALEELVLRFGDKKTNAQV